MPPAPRPRDDAARIEALLQCDVLDTAPEAAFDDLTALAARLCDAPIALVSLLDEHRQWFKSRVGIAVDETPRDQAFCGYAILADAPLVIPDARDDPRVRDSPLVTGPPGLRFYAGMPLVLSTGEALGTLCILDTVPREIDDAALDDLRALGRQATSQLELRRTIRRLELANAEAWRATEAKSAFLANMSHELRTPMVAILGHLELLEQAGDRESVADDARTIRRNAELLLRLIDDLLDLSKIEAGHMLVELVPTSPADVARDAAALLRPLAERRGLRLDLRLDPPLPASIASDPTRLRQILINLAGNAVKFTPEGSVEIRVACDPDAERLRIVVADTGIGMTAEQCARVSRFEPFTQADASVTRRFGGTGLGLPLSSAFAELLGGSLTIDSAPGRGTRVTLALPTGPMTGMTLLDAGALAAMRPSADPPAPPLPDLTGARILLVEDGVDNRRLVERHLRRAGATVEIAENGRVALDRLRAGPHDLVLMDMQMPELDGYEATRRLRAAGSVVPVVALTAHAVAGERERCLDAGCDDYLAKPIARRALLATCRRWLDARPRDRRAA